MTLAPPPASSAHASSAHATSAHATSGPSTLRGAIAATITRLATTATGIHGVNASPFPLRLKTWRITTPTAPIAASTAHPSGCPYVNGKWLLTITNRTGNVR